MSKASVTVINGDDDVLIAEAVRARVTELLGDADPTLASEELTEADYKVEGGGFEIARLVDAAQTPPFLTDVRVVTGRHMSRFTKADHVAALVSYLEAPLETTRLVLVWEKGINPKQERLGAMPKSLKSAIAAVGAEVIDTAVPRGRAASGWLEKRLNDSTLRFDRRAVEVIAETLGEDRSKVIGLLRTLESAFEAGNAVAAEELEPFLIERGAVPPWELTDAIAEGDIPKALDRLHRMLGGGRHPLQLMASLQGNYEKLLRLDGSGATDEKSAAKLLAMKGSTFPAKKLVRQARSMGTNRIGQAIGLLADADLALRGTIAWPDELVMEVLVARLSRLSR
ncbi:MAG: DNA polymerase III subunit delta [Acidimicrobiales bacterium]